MRCVKVDDDVGRCAVPWCRSPVSVSFDEPNRVSAAGLLPVMTRDAGMQDLADEWLIVPTDKARTPGLKVASLIVKTPQPREWPGTTGISLT